MKKWICWLLILLSGAAACAEETSVSAASGNVTLTVGDCRIVKWQEPSGYAGAFDSEIQLSWKLGNSDMDDCAGYFFDVGDVAYTGTGSFRTWEPGYDLRPGDPALVMGYMPALYGQWVINETAVFGLNHSQDSVGFPFELAFQISLYEPLNRTSDLRLDVLRWSMKKESDRIYAAKPDIPEMNGGSDVPAVLADFQSMMEEGGSWDERLEYQRSRAQLRRTVMKINGLGKPLTAWEVHIIFEAMDRPGQVTITEIY